MTDASTWAHSARTDCPRCGSRLFVDRDGAQVAFVCNPCLTVLCVETPADREARDGGIDL